MIHRMFDPHLEEGHSFFLFGPRGTGKTTWLKTHLPEAIYINLLEAEYANLLMANPGKLKTLFPPHTSKWVVIDEIQRVPDCLNEVHHLIESQKIKFVLTGSSARKLKRSGTNLLAGRAFTSNLYPLTISELGEKFDLFFALKNGCLPSLYDQKINPSDYLNAYIQTYLREEVFQESLVRQQAVFSRFLEVASFSQGSVVNTSEIARELGLDRGTVENYFTILEDLLIGYRIPCFSRRAKRRLIQSTKFYFFDAGVFHHIRPKGPLDSTPEIQGLSLETLVLQELMAINQYLKLGYQLFFWRTSTGQEVDFVCYGERGLIAIEIKRSDRITEKDLKGLKLFIKDYPEGKALLFYGGTQTVYEEGITLIPVEKALKELPALLGAG